MIKYNRQKFEQLREEALALHAALIDVTERRNFHRSELQKNRAALAEWEYNNSAYLPNYLINARDEAQTPAEHNRANMAIREWRKKNNRVQPPEGLQEYVNECTEEVQRLESRQADLQTRWQNVKRVVDRFQEFLEDQGNAGNGKRLGPSIVRGSYV